MHHDFSAVTAELQMRQSERSAGSRMEVISSLLAAIATGNAHQAKDHFHAKSVLSIHGFPPLNTRAEGPDEIVTALTHNFSLVTEQVPQLEALVEQDNFVIAKFNETGRLRESGQAYSAHGMIWFTFEGDQVSKTEEYVELSFTETR